MKTTFPRPLLKWEGVPAGRDDFRWLEVVFCERITTPSPLGEGWGEVLN